MKIRLLIVLSLLVLTVYGQEAGKIQKTELIGEHWAGKCNNADCDTLTFQRFTKYDGKLYQWGSGYGEGIELYEDRTAQTFKNVLGSDETNPVDLFTSKWELQGDTLVVDGYYIKSTYRIIGLNKKELVMVLLDFKKKEIR